MSAEDRWLDICTLLSELQSNQVISDVKLDLSNHLRIAVFQVLKGKLTTFKKSEEFRALKRLSDSLVIDKSSGRVCATITVDVTPKPQAEASQESHKNGRNLRFDGVYPLAFITSLWYNISSRGKYCRKGGAV